jgi:phosphotriesterase-related protein
MSANVNTVTGQVSPSQLGRTLMHEHLLIGYPGAESDTARPGLKRGEMTAICVDRIEELKSEGVTSMLDPCPSDLGRDVEFIAEVAQKTGFQIICATGLYKEDEGGAAYWKFRSRFGPQAAAMAEVFIRDLTEGIGETGIRAGIIKIATGYGAITDYEKTVLEAAALASVETGAPITTHTDDGKLGDEQQEILTSKGVPANRIIIGHSCGTDDHDYHMKIVDGGSYLGFDRFGLDMLVPDEKRIAALLRVVEKGAASRVVVSHDSVWCWRGEPIPNIEFSASLAPNWHPLHFIRNIAPRLREGGATAEQVDMMLVENPRRFFAGEELPAL